MKLNILRVSHLSDYYVALTSSSSFFLFFFSILNLVLSLSFVLSPIFHVLLQHNGERDFLLDSGSGRFGSNQLVVLSLNNLT